MMKKLLTNILIGFLAIGLGCLVGGLSAGFIRLIDFSQEILWFESWYQTPWFGLLLCTIGGVLVGLCQYYFGDHPKNIQQAIQELGSTGRLAYDHLFQGLTTTGISLIMGASLGPEAAIITLLGGFSTWASDIIQNLRQKLNLHISIDPGEPCLRRWLKNWTGIILVTGALFVFIFGVKDLYSGGFLEMTEIFSWDDLIWSLPLGLLGLYLGIFYNFLLRSGKQFSEEKIQNPILRSTSAGIFFGMLVAWSPLMLFSGQHALQVTYDQAVQLGAVQLILLAFARLIAIVVLLNGGWKGGQFLPLMFSCAAIGLGLSQLLPFISAPTGILAIMAGLLVVVLPNPLLVLVMMALMFPFQYVGIIIVGVLAAAGGKAFLKQRLPSEKINMLLNTSH